MSVPEIEKIEKIDKRRANGGRRPGSGRKKLTPNKVNRSLREAAQAYTDEALAVLVEVMRGTQTIGDTIVPLPADLRAKAASTILDRGHGKPTQAIEGTGDGGAIVVEIVKFGAANAKD